MISTPQEIEQTAMAVANWIVYNNKPFVLPTDNGGKAFLAVLNEEQMRILDMAANAIANAEKPKGEEKEALDE